jgi:phosphatidylinositol alpha 1,6-mannosyltransferase
MRIAIVTESFTPEVNGVANSVGRVAEHLLRRGHEPLVVAPRPAAGLRAVAGPLPYPVLRVPSLPLPGYRQVRLGLPTGELAATLRAFRPDVIHLASPFVLGAQALPVARSLSVPTVAVFQTDIAAYARVYRAAPAQGAAWRWLRRLHNAATGTLAPSSPVAATLHAKGFQRVWLWRRGVDSTGFHPDNRSAALRRALAPDGAVLVGYVGRLAPEKRLDLLAETARLPGARLVIVGAGPDEAALRRRLPTAVFLGLRRGPQLARLYASFDVFVHTGPYETFGQAIQEAMASGLPVVAPAAGGPLDLVQPGRTGYLVPPGDGAATARAVAGLVADPQRRAEFGAAARSAVAGRTWAAVGDELIHHYLAVRSGDAHDKPVSVPA